MGHADTVGTKSATQVLETELRFVSPDGCTYPPGYLEVIVGALNQAQIKDGNDNPLTFELEDPEDVREITDVYFGRQDQAFWNNGIRIHSRYTKYSGAARDRDGYIEGIDLIAKHRYALDDRHVTWVECHRPKNKDTAELKPADVNNTLLQEPTKEQKKQLMENLLAHAKEVGNEALTTLDDKFIEELITGEMDVLGRIKNTRQKFLIKWGEDSEQQINLFQDNWQHVRQDNTPDEGQPTYSQNHCVLEVESKVPPKQVRDSDETTAVLRTIRDTLNEMQFNATRDRKANALNPIKQYGVDTHVFGTPAQSVVKGSVR